MEHLTLDSFKEKICSCDLSDGKQEWKYKGQLPCLIDFYADWCGPCKRLAPILEDVAKEFAGKCEIYKVDTEAEPQLAGMFGVQSIPTLLYVPMDGKPQITPGSPQKAQLIESIKNILKV